MAVDQPARLETERLVLTPLGVDDAEEMVVTLADPALYCFIGCEPPSLEGLRDRYRRLSVGRSDDGRQIWRNWVVRSASPSGRSAHFKQRSLPEGRTQRWHGSSPERSGDTVTRPKQPPRSWAG